MLPAIVSRTDTTKNVSVGSRELLSYAGDNETKTINGIAAADLTWYQSEIDNTRWSKAFPYQLLVVQAVRDHDKIKYRTYSDFRFTLPVPPESISFGMPFADRVQATLDGVVEERSGAPFRSITLRSTTGVLPGRAAPLADPGGLLSPAIFGGTVQAVTELAGTVRNTAAAISGRGPVASNLHSIEEFIRTDDKTNVVSRTTGYYQIQLLKRFFEAWASIAKTEAGHDLRLALAIWKEQEVYLVTPQGLSIDRSGASPLEYPYTLSLQAYKRIALGSANQGFVVQTPIRRSPNALARVLETLRNARTVIQSSGRVLHAISGDLKRLVTEPLREAILLVQDLQGLATDVASFPDEIKTALELQYLEMDSKPDQDSDSETRKQQREAKRLGDAKQTGLMAFRKPQRAPQFFEAIDLSRMRIPVAIQRQIDQEKKRVRGLAKKDLEARAEGIRRTLDEVMTTLGAGSSTYAESRGIRFSPKKSEPTDSDWAAIWALQDILDSYTALASTTDTAQPGLDTRMDLLSGLYTGVGEVFQRPQSKFAIPFPYGATLEGLARTYLGDPSRAHEIAHLNGLRSPFVDETGTTFGLQTNGLDTTVVIAKTSSIIVGQEVWLRSRTKRRIRTRITGLRDLGDLTYVSLQDSASDYRADDDAVLEAFLPHTTNSQRMIYIPSQEDPASNPWVTRSIPGVDEFDRLLGVGGVDLLLDQNLDLVITPDGNIPWAQGLANITQNVGILLHLRQGDLLDHPSAGLNPGIGISTADLDPGTYIDAVRKMLSQDPSFDRVVGVQISRSGNSARINIGAQIAGSTQNVAVGFDIA